MTLPTRDAPRRGFTLIELLLVVLILGIITATVLPNFGVALSGGRTAVAARQVAQTGRYARTMSLLNQAPLDFVVDCGSGAVKVEAGRLSVGAARTGADAFGAESLVDSGGARAAVQFGRARSRQDKDDEAAASWFRSAAGTGGVASASADFRDDDGNAEGIAAEIGVEQRLAGVKLLFKGYTDGESPGDGVDDEEAVVRIRYKANGVCRPYELSVASETSGEEFLIVVDGVGSATILTPENAKDHWRRRR